MSERAIPKVCLACKHIEVEHDDGYYGDDYSGGMACGLRHWSLEMSQGYTTISQVRAAFATAQTCPDYEVYTAEDK